MVTLSLVTPSGEKTEISAKEGTRLLEAVQSAGLPMEGACEGVMACSTCHVLLEEADFDRFPPPKEEEDDLLDITYGALPTSRLACQLELRADHDGLTIRLPSETRSLLF